MQEHQKTFECVGCGYQTPLDDRIRSVRLDCPNCGIETFWSAGSNRIKLIREVERLREIERQRAEEQ